MSSTIGSIKQSNTMAAGHGSSGKHSQTAFKTVLGFFSVFLSRTDTYADFLNTARLRGRVEPHTRRCVRRGSLKLSANKQNLHTWLPLLLSRKLRLPFQPPHPMLFFLSLNSSLLLTKALLREEHFRPCIS